LAGTHISVIQICTAKSKSSPKDGEVRRVRGFLKYNTLMKKDKLKNNIDPKDLMAVERATTGLFGTAISLIILGFVVEKFELFLHLASAQIKSKSTHIPQLAHIDFYKYLGVGIVFIGVLLALFTYRYYVRWINHLEKKEMDTDKPIYLMLALFIAVIGALLIFAMLVW